MSSTFIVTEDGRNEERVRRTGERGGPLPRNARGQRSACKCYQIRDCRRISDDRRYALEVDILGNDHFLRTGGRRQGAVEHFLRDGAFLL
jgi:hypothetical protein